MRLKTLALCSTSVALLAAMGSPAWAQTPPTSDAPIQTTQDTPVDPEAAPAQSDDAVEGEEDAELEAVVVTGLRRSLQSAQSIKRNSDQIVDVIVAEDIGKLPDVTAAESLARVTGVQVNRSRGESAGQVVVRGLPDLTTTFNGRDIFTAEARSVALGDFPAGGIAALEVFKSTTANLVEGGIAGLINVRSRRPFDFRDREVAGAIRGTYADQSGKYDPSGNILLSDRFDTGAGEIGVLINASYTQLRYLDSARFNDGFIAGARPDQVTNPAQAGVRFPDAVGIFYGQGDRSRPSVNAALQWRPSEGLELYADFLYQGFRDRIEDRRLFVPLFGDARFTNIVLRPGSNQVQSLTSANAVPPFLFQGATNGDTDTYQAAVGGVYTRGPIKVSADLAFTDSVFDQSIYSFDTAFVRTPVTDINFDVNREDGGVEFSFRNFDTNDPNNYRFGGLFDRFLVASGDDVQFRTDLEYETGISFIPEVQIGFRFVDRNGSVEAGQRFERGDGPLAGLPVDFGVIRGGFRNSDVQQTRTWVSPSRDSIRDNIGALRTRVGFPAGPPQADPLQTFDANEKSYAGYGQLDYEFNPGLEIDGVVGIRVVKTEAEVTGTSLRFVNEVATFSTETQASEYTDYLPTVSARVRLTDSLQLRLAANKTRTRANFNQLNPSLVIDRDARNRDDPTAPVPIFNARSGNADLRPLESNNYDATLEYYFSSTGNASVAIFRRDVSGFIADETLIVDQPGRQLQIRRPVNLNDAKLQGVEAALTTFFDYEFLPQWARGFGAQLNGTYIDEEGDLNGVSEYSYNVVALYERGPVSARLAYNSRSEFVNFVDGDLNNRGVEFTEDVSRLDFSGSVTPFENITLTFDASNILGEPFTNFRDYQDRAGNDLGTFPRDVRFEESIYSLGLRFRF